ncbi:hypothetical protein [Cellulomonas sp. PS-H5]|uniref:hypothetical protein n=1 Tax=Cellulomonas sp. PS-H5 TaxID=2820400 RepID=UPI001C4FCD3F|nr:hypothetical protein [Cellulomonas sp. PS-H5]MBW0254931.1 hypothetical protein [Cellulomonas sp. PS-H5]
MQLTVRVVAAGAGPRPAPGTPVRVEVRDVTEQDAASVLVAGVDAEAVDDGTRTIATVAVDAPDDLLASTADLVVWARVAVSGAERTSHADLVSTQSVAVPRAPATPEVDLPVVAI